MRASTLRRRGRRRRSARIGLLGGEQAREAVEVPVGRALRLACRLDQAIHQPPRRRGELRRVEQQREDRVEVRRLAERGGERQGLLLLGRRDRAGLNGGEKRLDDLGRSRRLQRVDQVRRLAAEVELARRRAGSQTGASSRAVNQRA
ncbi:MAG: hypothetical protein U0794_06195 [Isosphaeraceae bacterium]